MEDASKCGSEGEMLSSRPATTSLLLDLALLEPSGISTENALLLRMSGGSLEAIGD
jgi:hypothetical protein